MTLSLKQKAMLITAGIIVSVIAGSFAVAFIVANVPAQIIGNAIGGGLVAWFIYLFYAITLNRLEYEQKIKEINSK
jgi:formate/nitrite transporter FocA (FNT family)